VQHYIDSAADCPGQVLQKLGGAAAVIATSADSTTMTPLIPGRAGRPSSVLAGGNPLMVQDTDLLSRHAP